VRLELVIIVATLLLAAAAAGSVGRSMAVHARARRQALEEVERAIAAVAS
jgi:hypothetical protein